MEFNTSETPLLDNNDMVTDKKHGDLRQHIHWVFHFLSVTAIAGLLVGMQQSLQVNRRKCWDMFNYYCKGTVKLLFVMTN